MILLLLACQTAPVEEVEEVPEWTVATSPSDTGPFHNRLSKAQSPYLLQHAANPVDWYEWGEEAFERARALDRPIFLSIGYAACHWCHVMEEESFEDPATAALLNASFVAIKVDREERPDVDALYMDALHLKGDNGGWPASIFLTPQLEPFYAGTYFPDEPRHGKPSFTELLTHLSTGWETERADIDAIADRVRAALEERAVPPPGELPAEVVRPQAVRALMREWDPIYFGWGEQKFPSAGRLELLLEDARVDPDGGSAARLKEVLSAMDQGGIHDQLGGGFHRYTVDRSWTVPHFEKMLYDNAWLVGLYARASVVLGEARFAEVAHSTAAYLLRDMRHSDGTFYSSEDADSAGEEGTFYVWRPEQIEAVLGPADDVLEAYGVSSTGNFEHAATVLTRRTDTPVSDDQRQALFTARLERIPPPTDTKRVVAWNALAVRSLAEAGRLLGRPEYIDAAARCAAVLLESRDATGGLPRTLAPNAPAGSLDDYALLAEALIALYQADPDAQWLLAALQVNHAAQARFADPVNGGWYSAPPESTELLARRKVPQQGAEPGGWAAIIRGQSALWALGAPGVDAEDLDIGLQGAGSWLQQAPEAIPELVLAHERSRLPGQQIVITTPSAGDAAAILAATHHAWRPDRTLLLVTPKTQASLAPFAVGADKAIGDSTRAWICYGTRCLPPIDDLSLLLARLD